VTDRKRISCLMGPHWATPVDWVADRVANRSSSGPNSSSASQRAVCPGLLALAREGSKASVRSVRESAGPGQNAAVGRLGQLLQWLHALLLGNLRNELDWELEGLARNRAGTVRIRWFRSGQEVPWSRPTGGRVCRKSILTNKNMLGLRIVCVLDYYEFNMKKTPAGLH